MRQTIRTGALVSVGIVGAFLSACGNGSATLVENGLSPLPSGSHALPTVCRTYFGSPATIAKVFGVATLTRVPFWESLGGRTYFLQVYSSAGKIMCKYQRQGTTGDGSNDGLFLTLTTHVQFSSGDVPVAQAQSGAVNAYAYTADPRIHDSPTIQAWLQRVAARAKPPSPSSPGTQVVTTSPPVLPPGVLSRSAILARYRSTRPGVTTEAKLVSLAKLEAVSKDDLTQCSYRGCPPGSLVWLILQTGSPGTFPSTGLIATPPHTWSLFPVNATTGQGRGDAELGQGQLASSPWSELQDLDATRR